MKYLIPLFIFVTIISGCIPEEMMDESSLSYVAVTGQVLAPGTVSSSAPSGDSYSERAVTKELLDPVAGAIVTVEGTEVSGLTDDNGNYLLVNVPKGAQKIRVNAAGMPEIIQIMNIQADVNDLDIVVNEKNSALGLCEKFADSVAQSDSSGLNEILYSDVDLITPQQELSGRAKAVDWLLAKTVGLTEVKAVMIPYEEYNDSAQTINVKWHLYGIIIDDNIGEIGTRYSESGFIPVNLIKGTDSKLKISKISFEEVKEDAVTDTFSAELSTLMKKRWNGWRNNSYYDLAACYNADNNYFYEAIGSLMATRQGVSDVDVYILEENFNEIEAGQVGVQSRIGISYIDDITSQRFNGEWHWEALAVKARGEWKFQPGYETLAVIN